MVCLKRRFYTFAPLKFWRGILQKPDKAHPDSYREVRVSDSSVRSLTGIRRLADTSSILVNNGKDKKIIGGVAQLVRASDS